MNTDKKEELWRQPQIPSANMALKEQRDSVAKIAKVGKGTVYTYFENKEELFDEIVDQAIKQMMSAANKALREDLILMKIFHMCWKPFYLLDKTTHLL